MIPSHQNNKIVKQSVDDGMRESEKLCVQKKVLKVFFSWNFFRSRLWLKTIKDRRFYDFFNGRDHFNSILFVNPIIVTPRNWNLNVLSRLLLNLFQRFQLFFSWWNFNCNQKNYSWFTTNTCFWNVFINQLLTLLLTSHVYDAVDYEENHFSVVVSRSFLSTVRRVIKLAKPEMPTPNIQKNINKLFTFHISR